jgi:hypothetical protein
MPVEYIVEWMQRQAGGISFMKIIFGKLAACR